MGRMTDKQVNPTPKERFLSSENNVKEHHDLIQSKSFQRAEDFALAHYQRILARQTGATTDGQQKNHQVDGMVNGWKICGVHEFLSELRNLAEKPTQVQAPGLARTLDHTN
jgi:hypothetical protein